VRYVNAAYVLDWIMCQESNNTLPELKQAYIYTNITACFVKLIQLSVVENIMLLISNLI